MTAAEMRCRQRGGKWDRKTRECRMPIKRKKLTVNRAPHERRGHVKDVKPGPGVRMKRIPATCVSGSKFKIKDVGAPGRGEKKIPIARNNALGKHGYKLDGSARSRHIALSKAANETGSTKVYRRLLALRNVRERPVGRPGPSPPPRTTRIGKEWRALSSDMDYMKRNFRPRLTPKAAIAARKKR